MRTKILVLSVAIAAIAGCTTKYTIVPPAVDLTG